MRDEKRTRIALLLMILGNTAQRLYVRCVVRFFGRLPRNSAGILPYGKGFLGNLTENLHTDCVQSRQAGFVRCCLMQMIGLIIALPVGNVKGKSDSRKFSPAGIFSCGKPSEKTGHRNMPMTCFL